MAFKRCSYGKYLHAKCSKIHSGGIFQSLSFLCRRKGCKRQNLQKPLPINLQENEHNRSDEPLDFARLGRDDSEDKNFIEDAGFNYPDLFVCMSISFLLKKYRMQI